MAESLVSSREGSKETSCELVSTSPSPSPLSATKVFLDVELEYLDEFNGVTLGVCAMNKKVLALLINADNNYYDYHYFFIQSFSGPMHNILSRIGSHEHVRVIIFTDNTILTKPIEEWPTCDALIAFYSKVCPVLINAHLNVRYSGFSVG